MRKKLICLLMSIMLAALSLCGCGAQQQDAQTGEEVGMVNPIKEVTGPADFEPLGVFIDAPEGATDASYSTISDEIAQVRFKMSGRIYTYRAANTQEDISGVYEKFDELEQNTDVDADVWSVSIRVRTVGEGEKGALATWNLENTQFSLYTGDAADADSISTLAVKLAEAAIAHAAN